MLMHTENDPAESGRNSNIFDETLRPPNVASINEVNEAARRRENHRVGDVKPLAARRQMASSPAPARTKPAAPGPF
jgi:hypothetical protein